MKFEKLISNNSLNESKLNKILDKISNLVDLSTNEKKFLDKYKENDDKDYHMISKDYTVKIISDLKKLGRNIICDLHDRNGRIGLEILRIDNNFQDEVCNLILKGGDKFKLSDRFLYNLIWDLERNVYHLKEDSEYFEKILIDSDSKI
jgi:hypothetical protein